MSGKAEKWWTYTKNVLDYEDLIGLHRNLLIAPSTPFLKVASYADRINISGTSHLRIFILREVSRPFNSHGVSSNSPLRLVYISL